jgi:hypothetical protein
VLQKIFDIFTGRINAAFTISGRQT